MNVPPSARRSAISANFWDWNLPTYSKNPWATTMSNRRPSNPIGFSRRSTSSRFGAGSWMAISMP